MVALEFEGGAVEGAAGCELGFELFEEFGEVIGASGAWGEAGDDGDEFAAALFAADAELLVFGVEGFAAELITRAGAGSDGFGAMLAGDGLFEGGSVEEAAHTWEGSGAE